MRRALDLVQAATERTSPNPKVGCVIVRDGQVIGEGITQRPGAAHAEIVALKAAGAAAKGADLYVTLKPSCHTGRTPPCTDAIIEAGIARVFYGMQDPNPLVDGGGLRRLREAGIEVQIDLAEACQRHFAPFRRFMLDRRPWIILKAAVTLDGRIATTDGDSRWITGPEARREVHELRAAVDAVLVGSQTAILDDPRLTVRDAAGADPLRVVVGRGAEISARAALLGPKAHIFHGEQADRAHLKALQATGTHTHLVPSDAQGVDLAAVLSTLHGLGVVRLLVEGGGRLHGALLTARLADEAWLYVAPKLIGRGRPVIDVSSAPTIAQGWSLDQVEHAILGDDMRVCGLIRYPAAPNGG